jgi:hypothetical protein
VPPSRTRTTCACALLLVVGCLFAASPAFATAGVVIDNGLVQLGVHAEGHLNVESGNPSSGTGTSVLGLRYKPTNADATAPGCLCEGWGAADAASGTSGWANEFEGGPNNVDLVSFESTATTATSVVRIDDLLEVTHAYRPSRISPNLFEVGVTIKNIGSTTVEPRYRRVMDWDVEPTAFSEYVTTVTGEILGVGGPTALLDNDNDGFATANPLGPDGTLSGLRTGTFQDVGPFDHGARFDFGFSELRPGSALLFTTFYGAAPDEATALGALATVEAETYSMGQPDTERGPGSGEPNTFVFGFGGIGGEPVAPDPTIPAGAFGRWPKGPGQATIHYTYGGGHRYLGNIFRAAENWNDVGSSLRIAAWPGVPAANHISVFDVSGRYDWYGLVLARNGCEPGDRCVFSRNSLFMNRTLLDPENDFFRTLTATHEFGHALGLCHQSGGDCGVTLPASTRSIMHAGPVLLSRDLTYNTPQPHDRDLLRELYP